MQIQIQIQGLKSQPKSKILKYKVSEESLKKKFKELNLKFFYKVFKLRLKNCVLHFLANVSYPLDTDPDPGCPHKADSCGLGST